MPGPKVPDYIAILRGMKIVVNAFLREQERNHPRLMRNSQISKFTNDNFDGLEYLLGYEDKEKIKAKENIQSIVDFNDIMTELTARIIILGEGVTHYTQIKIEEMANKHNNPEIVIKTVTDSNNRQCNNFNPTTKSKSK